MIRKDDPLSLLRPPTGRMLGGVFSTHTIDERFVEWMLATLLPIHADPEADGATFLAEARRRLRETPIVVFADCHRYVGGHRMPFDVVLSARDTHVHARFALVLFDDHARLLVGSGNLSYSGYAGNAELFGWQQLSYGVDADVTALRELVVFLDASGVNGDGWERLKTQLEVLLDPAPRRSKKAAVARFIGGEDVIGAFLDAIPKSHKPDGVAVAAVTTPEDGAADLSGIFAQVTAWLAERKADSVPLDVILPWPDSHRPDAGAVPELDPEASAAKGEPHGEAGEPNVVGDSDDVGDAGEAQEPDTDEVGPGEGLEAAVDHMCGMVDPATGSIAFGTIEQVTVEHVIVRAGGARRQLDRAASEAGMRRSPPTFWVVDEVIGVGPAASLEALAETHDINWWLWPEGHNEGGSHHRRPLHGAWLLVQTKDGKSRHSHLLIGAVQPSVAGGRNGTCVSGGLAWRLQRRVTLETLAPELVPAPPEGFYLQEPWLPTGASTARAPLESCTYDPASRTLRLRWPTRVAKAEVSYTSATGTTRVFEGRPGIETLVHDFHLDPHSTEVAVTDDQNLWMFPIAVTNMASLIADEGGEPRSVQEWVAHHAGRRIVLVDGDEEVAGSGRGGGDDQRREPQRPVILDPRDVFAALEALRLQLEQAGPSLGAFDVLLGGPVGAAVFARCLLRWSENPALLKPEAWIYAQELVRVLEGLELDDSAAGRLKRQRVHALVDRLGPAFAELAPSDPKLAPVRRFYDRSTRKAVPRKVVE